MGHDEQDSGEHGIVRHWVAGSVASGRRRLEGLDDDATTHLDPPGEPVANAVRYDLLMAGAVIASAPALLMYFAAKRYIVEGVGRAGLKG